VQQHALGRIDAEALEQFGMAKRQLDHLAQRVDGGAHAAKVVIGDVGAALAMLLGIFGSSSTTCRGSMWTIPRGAVLTTLRRSPAARRPGR
jgi:hypothetical protein